MDKKQEEASGYFGPAGQALAKTFSVVMVGFAIIWFGSDEQSKAEDAIYFEAHKDAPAQITYLGAQQYQLRDGRHTYGRDVNFMVAENKRDTLYAVAHDMNLGKFDRNGVAVTDPEKNEETGRVQYKPVFSGPKYVLR